MLGLHKKVAVGSINKTLGDTPAGRAFRLLHEKLTEVIERFNELEKTNKKQDRLLRKLEKRVQKLERKQ